jgi:hypothetical protein
LIRSRKVLAQYATARVMDVSYEQVHDSLKCMAPYLPNTWLWEYRMRHYGVTREQAESEVARGGVGRVPYVREMLMSPVETVQFINRLGGRAVLAHPGELSKRTDGDPALAEQILQELLDMLVPIGLIGMEAAYFKHTRAQTEHFSAIARDRGLMITAGSDYHGSFFPKRSLGMAGMTYDQFLELKSAIQGA